MLVEMPLSELRIILFHLYACGYAFVCVKNNLVSPLHLWKCRMNGCLALHPSLSPPSKNWCGI